MFYLSAPKRRSPVMIGVYATNPATQRQHQTRRAARIEAKRAELAARLERLSR
jgi:hypothetical protein